MLNIPTQVLPTESCIKLWTKANIFSGHKQRSSWNMALNWKRNQSCANLYLRRINWMDFWWELLIFCDENCNMRSLQNPRLRVASLLFLRIVAFARFYNCYICCSRFYNCCICPSRFNNCYFCSSRFYNCYICSSRSYNAFLRKHCLGNVSRFKCASLIFSMNYF